MTNLFGKAALWPAEQTINYLLLTDNHVREQIVQFVGKSLEIKVHTPTMYVTAFINSDRVSLNAASAEELSIKATASVSGEATELLNILASNKEAPLANLKIEIAPKVAKNASTPPPSNVVSPAVSKSGLIFLRVPKTFEILPAGLAKRQTL